MLTIRKEQLDVFRANRHGAMQRRILAVARKAWPQRIEQLGERRFELVVARCVEDARRHGLEPESLAMRYVNVALALGSGFNRDGRFDWAPIILDSEMPPRSKVNALVRRTRRVLATGSGDTWQEGSADA